MRESRQLVRVGLLGARLHDLDGITAAPAHTPRRGTLYDDTIVMVDGVRCTSGLQTVVDLASLVDDLVWEQALESALHKKRFTLDQLPAKGVRGIDRIRRVLALRPPNAPPTESLLETLAVQMCRVADGVPEPTRQLAVYDEHDQFVARVDLCWPELGLFFELDGEHHKGQPVYDTSRESAVVAATGWLCIRSTWTEIYRAPKTTGRKLARIVQQAHVRPVSGLISAPSR